MALKREVRIIAWDDCAFRFRQKKVRLVGVIFRGGDFIDGMLSALVTKDGNDATAKIVSSILRSRHYDQLSYVMTNGISFAGLNILDINELYRKTRLPVIAVVRHKPDRKVFMDALKKFADGKNRIGIVKKTGSVIAYNDIYYQKAGLARKECEEILKITCTRSKIPEPIRVAHLIASGLSRQASNKKYYDARSTSVGYESRGRA